MKFIIVKAAETRIFAKAKLPFDTCCTSGIATYRITISTQTSIANFLYSFQRVSRDAFLNVKNFCKIKITVIVNTKTTRIPIQNGYPQ